MIKNEKLIDLSDSGLSDEELFTRVPQDTSAGGR